MGESNPCCVLFGGTSAERLVSVASAQNVAAALPGAALFFETKDGRVMQVASTELARHSDPFRSEFTPTPLHTWSSLDAALRAIPPEATTILALHGGRGEDGTVQGLFEALGLAFTGSDSRASAKAFDKATAKALVAAHGGVVARGHPIALNAGAQEFRALLSEFPRWVLKPVSEGSSRGLFHFCDASQIPNAARLIADAAAPYLAERQLEGRELTVGIVDLGDGPRPLPPSEVIVEPGASFDYEGKYLGRGIREATPAALDASEIEAAQTLAVLAHRALGCAGYSRSDLFLTAEGCVFLELNSLPGLTKVSLFPQQLKAAGIGFQEFLQAQVTLVQRRRIPILR